MRAIAAPLTRLARTFDAGVSVRVRVVRKSDGWTVDLTDHSGADWVRGIAYSEGLDNNTATFTIDLVRAIGENTLSPFRASKANREGTTADPVLAVKRWVIVEVQPTVPEGGADANNWIELVRGQIDRIIVSPTDNTIRLECRDESARFIDRWQEYERNWPATIPDELEDVVQDVLDTATYDPGPWVAGITRQVGDLIRTTAHNGYLYRCTTLGASNATTEPTWSTTPGATTNDNVAVWTNVGPRPAMLWTAGATKYLGSIVRPATPNGYLYQCTAVTGSAPYTTSAGPVTWPTTYGGTVVDNEVTWTLIEDAPDLYTPVSPSWLVTRAAADDYGLPPQAYWEIVRAFVDQIGWDCRFRWVSADGRRRPTLRSLDDAGSGDYDQNGNAGRFTPDTYQLTSEISQAGEHIRNVVEVVYFNGNEQSARRKTVLRVQDRESIAAYGVQFCQLNLDSTGLINDAAEASKLANVVLRALVKPTLTFSIRVPFMPWIEVGDGLLLEPRPEDAVFDGTNEDGDALVAVVQGLSHRADEGASSTELQLQGFFMQAADVSGPAPMQVSKWMNKDTRARLGKVPTQNRPGDVLIYLYRGTNTNVTPTVLPGVILPLNVAQRDLEGAVGKAGINYALRVPVAGLYSVTASAKFAAPDYASDECWLSIYDETAATVLFQSSGSPGTALVWLTMVLSTGGVVWLEPGAVVTLRLAFDPVSAGAKTLSAGRTTSFLSARLVR